MFTPIDLIELIYGYLTSSYGLITASLLFSLRMIKLYREMAEAESFLTRQLKASFSSAKVVVLIASFIQFVIPALWLPFYAGISIGLNLLDFKFAILEKNLLIVTTAIVGAGVLLNVLSHLLRRVKTPFLLTLIMIYSLITTMAAVMATIMVQSTRDELNLAAIHCVAFGTLAVFGLMIKDDLARASTEST